MSGLPAVFLQATRAHPVALGPDGELTACDLLALARGLKNQLGGQPHQEVVVVCSDRYYVAAALVGVWMSGHRVALAQNDRIETIGALRAHRPVLCVVGDGQDVADIHMASVAPAEILPTECIGFPASQPAACVYTSGTTGLPVAHEKTFAQLLGEAQMLGALFNLAGRRVLPTVPCHHIYGLLMGVLAPLMSGGSFVRETPLHPAQVLAAARRYSADTLVASPAHLKGLATGADVDEGTLCTTPLRFIFSSGAPLPAPVAAALHAQGRPEIVELFGSTETGGIAYRRPPHQDAWTPLPGVSVGLAAQANSAEIGASQLVIQSAYAVQSGWVQTGDHAALNADGTFTHKGRQDDVVKVGGRRVSVAALENRLRQIPGVDDAAVVALAVAPPRELELCCVLVATGLSIEEIRAQLLRWFDPVALPRRWRFVNQMPREPSGKLPKARLLAAFISSADDPELRIACETRTRASDPDGANHRFTIFVPPQAWFFRGHFDGDPLMPAVVQVNDLVLAHVAALYPELPPLRQATRLKFKHPIRPGSLLTLGLSRRSGSPTVNFELRVAGTECSSGVLEFAPRLG